MKQRPLCLFLGLALVGCGDAGTHAVEAGPGDGDAAVSTANDSTLDVAVQVGPDARRTNDGGPDATRPTGCTPAAGSADDPLRVVTTGGPARGLEAEGVRAWLGLPFAAPPVGDRRFAPPAAPSVSATTCDAAPRDATAFAAACLQVSKACATGTLAGCTVEGAEDCLYLNVWQPTATAAKRPVLFFIHGGGNAIGSTSEQPAPGTYLYDGAALAAATGALVVTTAYRLGPFGWAAHPELARPENGGRSGNFGLLDQMAALKWVRANAEAFGADPNRVAIFGESAGGADVCMLLASPVAGGLFQAALIESGGCPAYTMAQVAETTSQLVAAAGCAGAAGGEIACLRGKPGADLLLAMPPQVVVAGRGSTLFQPAVDGDLLPEAPLTTLAAGRGNHVPTVVGSNAEETAASLPPASAIPDEAAYSAVLRADFGPLAPQVLAQYPVRRFASPWEALMRVTTDAKFVCPTRTILHTLHDAPGAAPVWRYFYTHHLENIRRAAYAQHGIELFFVFQHLSVAGYRPSADEVALAGSIADAWGGLASAGDPGTAQTPWAPWTPETDHHLVLQGGDVRGDDGVRTADCDFWETLR